MKNCIPRIENAELVYRNKNYTIEYFIRSGEKGTILFVHGLGGCKENYWLAVQSVELRDYCLIGFDNPGTGNSTYYEDDPLDVDDLTEIATIFIQQMALANFILVGTSMGGLITLLYLKNMDTENVKAYINIEGNLLPEDCMFSSQVIEHAYPHFAEVVFPQTIQGMKTNGNPGYHIIANNLEMNTNVRSYFGYSFQTVQYSSTGELIEQYLDLSIPKIFIYGEKNSHLSYIPRLTKSGKGQVKMIHGSDHFMFYDNPKALYQTIGEFVNSVIEKVN